MATIGQWIGGARPRTLPAAVAPVVAGTGVAAAEGGLVLARAVLALGVALALQIGVNYANDYSDGVRGTDANRVGPVRLVGQGLAPAVAVKWAAIGCLALAGVLGLVLVIVAQAWWWLLIGAASIAAAWLYTGGPKPYGYLGLGEIFVFLFFGPVAVIGTAYVQTGQVTLLAVLASIPVGLLSCLILVANNLRDIPTDIDAGKTTLAVKLGDTRTRHLFAAGALLTYAVVLGMSVQWPGAIAGLIGAIPASGATRTVLSGVTGRDLVPVLGRTGLALLLTGFGLGFGLGLVG